MENLIYLSVKVLSAIYLLYRIFHFLFGKKTRDFWNFLAQEKVEKEKTSLPALETAPYSIVGKSQTVYLEEMPKQQEKTPEPVFSEDLQRTEGYEEEPDIPDEDVDDNLSDNRLLEEERFLPLDTNPDDGDFPSSTGMTYEQIYGALDVVQGNQTDDASCLAAARILYEAQGSDLFNFLTAQAENEALIEKLIRENLDSDGTALPENRRKQRRDVEEFDMDKYV